MKKLSTALTMTLLLGSTLNAAELPLVPAGSTALTASASVPYSIPDYAESNQRFFKATGLDTYSRVASRLRSNLDNGNLEGASVLLNHLMGDGLFLESGKQGPVETIFCYGLIPYLKNPTTTPEEKETLQEAGQQLLIQYILHPAISSQITYKLCKLLETFGCTKEFAENMRHFAIDKIKQSTSSPEEQAGSLRKLYEQIGSQQGVQESILKGATAKPGVTGIFHILDNPGLGIDRAIAIATLIAQMETHVFPPHECIHLLKHLSLDQREIFEELIINYLDRHRDVDPWNQVYLAKVLKLMGHTGDAKTYFFIAADTALESGDNGMFRECVLELLDLDVDITDLLNRQAEKAREPKANKFSELSANQRTALPVHLQSLELRKAADQITFSDIRTAYRTLVLVYHPDKTHGATPEARKAFEERFKKVQSAMEFFVELQHQGKI